MSPCRTCGTELPTAARFCLSCGSPTSAPGCSSCGVELPEGARFCLSCGAPQSAAVPDVAAPAGAPPPISARRVTSVLFGDLVGFTALSETRDQEDVRELLSRYFEECRLIVTRYGGTIEKFIGDAVMAVWGVPTAHEDDAERAVRAGLELVTAIAGLRDEVSIPTLDLRVGIVTGEVAVTIGATGQGMVAGDPVNTAARVQSAAAPGQVWVDETTRLLTHAAITYADVGSHQLKGKVEPVPLWSVRAVVAAVGGGQRADGLEGPLVARDRELRLVKELFHRTEETKTPSLLLLSSQPGLGKTRLGWEFSKYTDGLTNTVRWLEGRCPAYGDSVAYFALAEAIRGRLRSLVPGDDADEVGEAGDGLTSQELIQLGLDRFVPDGSEREWLGSRLAALLGVGSGSSFGQEDLFAAWVRFLELMTVDSSAMVLLVDDAQNADDGFIDFLQLALQIEGLPLFVLLQARDELLHAHPGLATNRRVTVLNLSPLTDRDMARLITGLVSGLPDGATESLVRRADGVPLFAVETVRSLIDHDLVVPRGGQYVLTDPDVDLSRLEAPASMQALVASRLDTLDPSQRRVVDDASVLGLDFSPETLSVLSRDHVTDLGAVLESLVRRQILIRDANPLSGGYGRYGFVQEVVRQVAYGMLSRRDRRAAHLRVANFLGDEKLELAAVTARHLIDAAEAVPAEPDVPDLQQRAIQLLQKAGERSWRLGLPVDSMELLQQASDLCVDPVQRADVALDLARAASVMRDFDQTCSIVERALPVLEAAGNQERAAVAAAELGYAYGNLGRSEEAITLLEPWWERLRDRRDIDVALTELGSALSLFLGDVGRSTDSLTVALATLGAAERLGHPTMIARAINRVAWAHLRLGQRRLAGTVFEAAVDYAAATRLDEFVIASSGHLALLALPQDLEQALGLADRVDELITTTRMSHMRHWAMLYRLTATFLGGDWASTTAGMEEYADGVEPLEQDTFDFIALRMAAARGDGGGLPEESASVDAADSPTALAGRLLRRAMWQATQGDDEAGASTALRSVRAFLAVDPADGEFSLPVFDTLVELVAAGRQAHQIREVLELLQVEDDDQSLTPAVVAWRSRLRGHLALVEHEDVATVEAHWAQAVTAYELWGADHLARRTEEELARVLLDDHRVAEATAVLDRVREHYERIGATAWLAGLPSAVATAQSSGS